VTCVKGGQGFNGWETISSLPHVVINSSGEGKTVL